jgi:alpha-beta hydrolase superfamily lysophospholipase
MMESVAKAVAHETSGVELVRDWTPQGQPKATVVLVHGLGEHSGRYERTGSLLSDAGFRVRSFDLAGAGASGGARWDIDDWSRYHDQIQTHVEWARSQVPRVVLMGHSMGGNLALGYALDDRPRPDLLVLSAPALGGGAAWQRAVAPVFARLMPRVLIPNQLRGEQLSRDPQVAEAYFADPLVYTKSTPRLGAALFRAMDEAKANLHRLDIPTLVLHGGEDTIVPPESTEILAELPGVERRVYEGLRHEILNEPEGPEIVAEIADWIDARL